MAYGFNPPESWSEGETNLWTGALSEIGGREAETIADDTFATFLYHEAFFDTDLNGEYRQSAYEAFIGYMEETYGVEWEDVFDWDAFREEYNAR